MRRVIGGKTYNSNTAEQLHKADMRHLGEQFWYQERLFRTKDGDHFLIGIGGPLTRWNDEVGMVALNEAQTAYWLDKHRFSQPGWMADKRTVVEVMNEVEVEADGKAYIGFYADPEHKRKLAHAAELEAMSVSELLCLLVRAYNDTGKLPGVACGC
jgi:hypothetical protein